MPYCLPILVMYFYTDYVIRLDICAPRADTPEKP